MNAQLEQLLWALQALAMPATVQRQLFPSGVCVPDELVLDFDECWRHVGDLTEKQQSVLKRLDETIDRWSGLEHPDVWEDSALDVHVVWHEFRTLAVEALKAFSWPIAEPPSDRGKIYIA